MRSTCHHRQLPSRLPSIRIAHYTSHFCAPNVQKAVGRQAWLNWGNSKAATTHASDPLTYYWPRQQHKLCKAEALLPIWDMISFDFSSFQMEHRLPSCCGNPLWQLSRINSYKLHLFQPFDLIKVKVFWWMFRSKLYPFTFCSCLNSQTVGNNAFRVWLKPSVIDANVSAKFGNFWKKLEDALAVNIDLITKNTATLFWGCS